MNRHRNKNKSDKLGEQKSLEVLENNKWPHEKEYPTGLIKRCHEYRKIPVDQLTAEQIRTLISQKTGLKYLLPIAIEFLTQDILTEADLYPGDLLESVLKIDEKSWTQHINFQGKIIDLIRINTKKIREEDFDLGNWSHYLS